MYSEILQMTQDKAVTVHQDQPVQVFNPLDAPTAVFTNQLQSRQTNYDALAMHLRGMLVPGHDFGKIHVVKKAKCPKPWGCTNPSHFSNYQLFAAGADKVLGILGLGVNYPGEQDVMRAALSGRPLEEVIIKCQIVDHQGQVVAEELGACARAEVGDSLNNAVKRACKRARVGAVMRLPSISALFEADFLAEIEAAGQDNSTSSRARQPQQNHNTGAELEVMPFGKHQGERFADLGDDYLEWITRNMSDKPDIHAAAVKVLESRTPAPDQGNAPPGASQAGSGDDGYDEWVAQYESG